jgi:hypothetical protein
MRHALVAAILLASAVTAPAWAQNGNILLLFGDDCDVQLGTNCRTQMHVYGLLHGASQAGITGAEYSIEGGVSGFLFAETFPAAAVVIGAGALAPLANGVRGVNVAWPTCQPGGGPFGTYVLLETVDVLRVDGSLPTEVILRVVKHGQPSNQFFQCPLFTLCDAPVYTKVCVGSPVTQCRNPEPPHANDAMCSTGAEAFINGRQCCLSCPGAVVDCPVAAQATTWSCMKGLYHD